MDLSLPVLGQHFASSKYHSFYTAASFGIHIILLGSLCISETFGELLGFGLENARYSRPEIWGQLEMTRKEANCFINNRCDRGFPNLYEKGSIWPNAQTKIAHLR